MVTSFKQKLLDLGKEINDLPTPVIDPRDIDIETKRLIKKYTSSEEELIRTGDSIDSQTVLRDLDWYIKRATHVVAYYPEGTTVSKGVSDECTQAHKIGKDVFVIYPYDRQSPFMGISHETFKNADEFFEFFPDHMKKMMNYYKRKKK
jgi:hypothetical protein